jgi:chemotaxis protein MotA
MIILVGTIVVIVSVIGGFLMADGNVRSLLHFSEVIIIAGAGVGTVIIMAPKKVLFELSRQTLLALKGAPFKRRSYDELFMVLYELFLLGRRNGLIALEEHLVTPAGSAIFKRYPTVAQHKDGVEFLCGALRPVIDGRVKPDQLRLLLETDLSRMEEEGHAPIGVLSRMSDSLPGFGIVAAVLGIVNTMAAIAGPIEKIGEKVAAALVGTFLGIFLAYGFVSPVTVNMEFNLMARLAYFRCISAAVVSFAGGMAPGMAVELARRSLSEELRPDADELEKMLKTISANASKGK